ncbi:MAG TPA: hypothetical protein VGO60_01010 [Iamia sp.]|jgi:hypothetical protein|nr:hypothetical protein [Iamia sp.]
MHDDIDTLGTAVLDGVPAPPPVDGVHRRLAARRRRAARGVAAGVTVAALALGGLALARATNEPATSVATEGAEPGPPPPDVPVGEDEIVPVGDGEQVFGYLQRVELSASQDRVVERGHEIFRDHDPTTDADIAVLEALHVIEAAPVRDEAGQVVVGYWSTNFIPAEDYSAAVEQANQLIEAYGG